MIRRLRRNVGSQLAVAVLAVVGLGQIWIGIAKGQALVADLSTHLIAITTGFTGTDVVLFGAVDGPGDVAVIVTGPRTDMTVRRKDQVAGAWVNLRSVTFEDVPSFYAVATNRPLAGRVDQPVLDRHGIELDNLRLEPADGVEPGVVAEFRTALLHSLRREGLYSDGPRDVIFLGDRLFRTNIYFPARVPTGIYSVGIFLMRDGDVISAQTTPLSVSKIGLSAEIYSLALRRPIVYGVIAVIGAVVIGWAAGALFRE